MQNKGSLNIKYVQQIVESLNTIDTFEKVIILVSGDCAFSGKQQEYKYVKYLIGNLIKRLKEKYGFTKEAITVLVVPGNHDLDCSKNSLSSEKLNSIFREEKYEAELQNEFAKLSAFFDFSKYNACFLNDSLYDRKIIDFDGFSIQFNLINTAAFSLVHDEDKGLHYLPDYKIQEIAEPSTARITVTIMHHAPEWFCDNIKHKLMHELLSKSSIVFYGHEHYQNYVKTMDQHDQSIMLCGGSLCNNNDWSNSSFFAGILDTQSVSYSIWSFELDCNNSIYVNKKMETINLPRKTNNSNFKINKDFYEDFLLDKKHNTQKDFRNRFIFPRLISNNDETEIVSFEDFQKNFLAGNRMIIAGSNNSGKTTLLKYLFDEFSKKKVVIYLDAETISGSKIDKILKNAFEDIYSDEGNAFAKFLQLPKEEKVLIFDNVDRIHQKQLDLLFENVESHFGYYILSTKQAIELNIFERLKKEIGDQKDVVRFKLTPWYSDKRKQLITSIIKSDSYSETDIELVTDKLDKAIKIQQAFANLTPDFITQYVEFYFKNLTQLSGNDSGIFGKVFEGNITNAIKNNTLKHLSVDKIFTVLSKIAYYIHVNQKYPIDEASIFTVITDYNDIYGDNISPYDIISIARNSLLIIKNENTNCYQFTNKSYLSFFIAKEINKKYNIDQDETDIRNVIEYSCYDINSEILLFLIYITDNPRILNLILAMAKFYTDDWTEYSLSHPNIDYLNGVIQYDVSKIDEETIEKINKDTLEDEKESIQTELLNAINIYDYPKDSSELFVNKVFRSISLLTVISRCLPNFEHMMKKEDKFAFTDMIYKLPNKIFNLWAKSVDEDKALVIEFIKRALSCEYQKQARHHTEKELASKAIEILVINSVSLLLDIYNAAATNAAKDNTIGYLSGYDYKSDDSYAIEHLLMLCNQNKTDEFINEVERILTTAKHPLVIGLVKRVTNYALYNMKALTRNNKARLIEKCFPENSNKNILMLSKPKE